MAECFHVVSIDASTESVSYGDCDTFCMPMKHIYVYMRIIYMVMNMAIWFLSSRNYINRYAMITTQREIKKYNFVSISFFGGWGVGVGGGGDGFLFSTPRVSTRGTASWYDYQFVLCQSHRQLFMVVFPCYLCHLCPIYHCTALIVECLSYLERSYSGIKCALPCVCVYVRVGVRVNAVMYFTCH